MPALTYVKIYHLTPPLYTPHDHPSLLIVSDAPGRDVHYFHLCKYDLRVYLP